MEEEKERLKIYVAGPKRAVEKRASGQCKGGIERDQEIGQQILKKEEQKEQEQTMPTEAIKKGKRGLRRKKHLGKTGGQ